MAATEIVKRIYRPSALVGQVYAAVYGSDSAMLPIGNVLDMQIDYAEDVQNQDTYPKLI